MPMSLRCSECKTLFNSLVIDNKLAFQDIYKGLMDHVIEKHKKQAEELSPISRVAVESLVLVFTLQSFAEIDESETALDKILTDAQVAVMQAIGYDPAEQVDVDEDEEEDEEEDKEEEEKEEEIPVFEPE